MKRRWYNLFKDDGKAVILAFDHSRDGRVMGVDQAEVITQARKGGVDGILASYGTAKYYKKEIGNLGLVVRMDLTPSAIAPRWGVPQPAFGVKEIARLGGDACMIMGFPSAEYDYEMTRNIAQMVVDCDKYGLVASAEMLPNGFSSDPADRTMEKMGIALRAASGLGVDFIKTDYVGTVTEYKAIVDTCAAPVLVLGNGKKSTRDFLQTIRNAMDSGCKGLVVGRNIWQSNDIQGICRALVKIVHEDTGVDEAIKEIK